MRWIDLLMAFLARWRKWDDSPLPEDEPHNPPPAPTIPDPLEGPKQPQDETSAPEPLPVPTSSPEAPRASVETLCRYIELREGANPANNNPGNCKFYKGGYAPIYGVVRESPGGFAMFATKELGWLYLNNLVKQKIKKHPNWTLYQFFADEHEGYAPASDNNDPLDYSRQAAKRMGITSSTPVGTLLG